MRLVGLLGKKGSGKDTAADALEKLGYYRTSFAKALKKEVMEGFLSLPEGILENRGIKETPIAQLALTACKDPAFGAVALRVLEEERKACKGTGWFINPVTRNYVLSPRKVMQLWGTEYRRSQDNEYWIKKVDEELAYAEDAYGLGFKAVITDLREPHETGYVLAERGDVILIERPNNPYENVGSASHSSETQVASLPFTHKVVNDGSVLDLQGQILETVGWK